MLHATVLLVTATGCIRPPGGRSQCWCSRISRRLSSVFLRDIARESGKGRVLLIGTTDLDAQRPVLWDMGRIRQQLTDLLATRLLTAHAGMLSTRQSALGGLSPAVLRRAIERLQSDSDADVSLAALASDAGLSRFHFCRAFKESTGLSPHTWLRRHRLDQAVTMLRAPDTSVVSVAAALGYPRRLLRISLHRCLRWERSDLTL
jgi:AraC-like DNA-binding protein